MEDSSSGNTAKRHNSFEMEVSQEIEKNWTGARHGGIFVPWSIRHALSAEAQKRLGAQIKTRAGLDSGTATAGAELKFTEPGEFIQFLYNSMRVKELGARTIAGLRDNVSYPKQTGRATGSWVGENPSVDVADSALTLGSIASSPKTYQSSSSYSRQLLAQAVIDVDTLVREDLGRDMALAVDSVAIVGGGTNQPTGIVATSGVQSYIAESDSGNGGALAWDDIVKMSELLEDANADQLGDGAWLTTPGIKSSLKRTARLGNTIGLPIWADDSTVDGYRARSSNQVAKAGTKGSGTALHTIIRGIFETMVIGMWGSGFELVVDPYRLKKQGMIELTTFMLTDVTLKYPVAFVVAKFVVTT
jgi:HK97 family phage major capsid protein